MKRDASRARIPNEFARGVGRVCVDSGNWAWSGPSDLERVDVRELVERQAFGELAEVDLIVLGTQDAKGDSTGRLAARLRNAFPHVAIFICVALDGCSGTELVAYAWAGVDEVFVLGSESDIRCLEAAVQRRVACPVPKLALLTLGAELQPSEGRTILLWALRSGWMQPGQAAGKKLFSIDVKTINKKLSAIGFPRLGSVFRYSVLFHSAVLRSDASLPFRHIAQLLGFSDAHSLSRKHATVARHVSADTPGGERLSSLLVMTRTNSHSPQNVHCANQ